MAKILLDAFMDCPLGNRNSLLIDPTSTLIPTQKKTLALGIGAIKFVWVCRLFVWVCRPSYGRTEASRSSPQRTRERRHHWSDAITTWAADGRSANGRSADGRSVGRQTDGRRTDGGRSADGRTADGRRTVGGRTDGGPPPQNDILMASSAQQRLPGAAPKPFPNGV